MSRPKRLHPVAIFFNLFILIRHSLFAIVAGLFAFKGQSLFYFIVIALAVSILFLIHSSLSWYRFTYQVEEDELRIEHGIFIRKKRYISKSRIQSIDLTASILHRLTGLIKVQIETAGSGDGAEASLSAVNLSEGERLRKALKIGAREDNKIVQETAKPSNKISFKRLFLAGSTSGSIGIILAIAVFGFSEIEQFIPEGIYNETMTWALNLSIVLIVGFILAILIFLWLLGIAGTMIKYGNFTIIKNKDELLITRGLLEKKQLTIPLHRIQAVGIEQSLIRQPLGYVTLYAVVAGGSMDKGEDFPILFPIMKRKEVETFLGTFLPDFGEVQTELVPLPKRARKFYLLRSTFPFILLALVIGYFFPQVIWIPAILLLINIYLGVLRHQDGGFRIEGNRLTIRFRLLSKVTIIMYHRRVQAFEKRQHKVQSIERLATMQLSIIGSLGAGTHYKIKDLDQENADDLADWYSHRT